MNIDIDGLFKKDAFKNIEPEKMDAFKKFAALINGKSAAEIMPLFMQFSRELSKGKPVSKQDTDAMLSAVYESLQEPERNKLTGIIKMLEAMGGRGGVTS